MLAQLIERPWTEIHALELMGSGADTADGGDSGELLDAEAIADYKQRIRELDERIEDATELGNITKAERHRAEREALANEIARAVGLGGKARRAGGAAERARSAVRRRIKDAIDRIAEQNAELGQYLERTIKTGTYCSYRPDGGPSS
jgi:hypothetical protein